MHAENSASNYCCHREVVESICNRFKDLDVYPTFAFVIEAVYFVDLAGLVVSPQQEEGGGMLHFEPHEQADAL